MGAKKYILRVVRYLLKMVLLLGLIFVLMIATKTSQVSADELLAQLFGSQKGILMLVALFGVSLAYPKFGYVERVVTLDIKDDRTTILEVLSKMGYTLRSENGDIMTFDSVGLIRKVMSMGDDSIVINGTARGAIVLDGLRKDVVVAEFRLNSTVEKRENK